MQIRFASPVQTWADSTGRGKGSTFSIEIPVKPRPEEMQFKEFIEGI